MRLDRFIAKSRIIDIESNDLEGSVRELLEVSPLSEKGKCSRKELLKALMDREETMTTYLGNGIGMPHLRVSIKQPYIFAIGRCRNGLEYEGLEEYKDLRIIILLLASEKEKSYLKVLASLASIFQDQVLVDRLVDSNTLSDFRDQVKLCFGGGASFQASNSTKFNRLIVKECSKIAKGADCSSVMIFGDTFEDGFDLGQSLSDFKTILVTQASTEVNNGSSDAVNATIAVRAYSRNRLSQMRSAVLIGLSRGIFKFNDKICCLTGISKSNQFDTVVVVDIQEEFQAVFNQKSYMLPSSVKPEVMERVLAIATELAVEGREGKPVGCLFVMGEADELKPFTKPLVINPFYGYKDEDRNILNPFMDETVKEFSTIDGAFIIRGDGVLESAGSLIHAPEFSHDIPSGLGARHAAASAISQAADCLTVVVSASTRQVTLFRRGQMLPLM